MRRCHRYQGAFEHPIFTKGIRCQNLLRLLVNRLSQCGAFALGVLTEGSRRGAVLRLIANSIDQVTRFSIGFFGRSINKRQFFKSTRFIPFPPSELWKKRLDRVIHPTLCTHLFKDAETPDIQGTSA